MRVCVRACVPESVCVCVFAFACDCRIVSASDSAAFALNSVVIAVVDDVFVQNILWFRFRTSPLHLPREGWHHEMQNRNNSSSSL